MAVKMPPSHCTDCGQRLDAASAADGSHVAPKAGDMTVCIGCAAVMVFTGRKLQLRAMTIAEFVALDDDSKVELGRVVAAVGKRRRAR